MPIRRQNRPIVRWFVVQASLKSRSLLFSGLLRRQFPPPPQDVWVFVSYFPQRRWPTPQYMFLLFLFGKFFEQREDGLKVWTYRHCSPMFAWRESLRVICPSNFAVRVSIIAASHVKDRLVVRPHHYIYVINCHACFADGQGIPSLCARWVLGLL